MIKAKESNNRHSKIPETKSNFLKRSQRVNPSNISNKNYINILLDPHKMGGLASLYFSSIFHIILWAENIPVPLISSVCKFCPIGAFSIYPLPLYVALSPPLPVPLILSQSSEHIAHPIANSPRH
jgi:hypothetical protein